MILAGALGAGVLAMALAGSAWGSDGARANFILMVFNNPVAGREAEYNDWYNHKHAGMVTGQLKFDHAQRFHQSAVPMGGTTPRQYMVMYSGTSTDIAQNYTGYYANNKKDPKAPKEREEIDHTTNYNDSFRALGDAIGGAGPLLTGRGAPQTYLWFVYSKARPGQETAFDDWSAKVDVPTIAHTKGIVQAQRYLRTGPQLGNATRVPSPPYLTIYTIQTNDIAVVMADAQRRKAAVKDSPAADPAAWVSYGWQAIGPIIR